jgi:hypothetical protein
MESSTAFLARKGKLQPIGAMRIRGKDRRRGDRRRVPASEEETSGGQLTSNRSCSLPTVRSLRDLCNDRGGSEVNQDVVGVMQDPGLRDHDAIVGGDGDCRVYGATDARPHRALIAAPTAGGRVPQSAPGSAACDRTLARSGAVGPPPSLRLGERSKQALDQLRRWMSNHNAAIMAVLCLIIAMKLIGDAISGF